MKTRDEFVAAMMEMGNEAKLSGFTFCAMLDADDIATIIQCGRPLIAAGLCATLQHRIQHEMKKA